MQHRQAHFGAVHLGFSLRGIVLCRFVIALRSGVMLEETLLSLVLVLGRNEIRARLDQIGPRGTKIRTLDDRQTVALAHPLAERSENPRDTAAHGGKDVSDAAFVEGHSPGSHQMQRELALLGGSDGERGALYLSFSQRDLARRRHRLRDFRSAAGGYRRQKRRQ